MAETIMQYRMWVLRHFDDGAWSIPRESVMGASKGRSALAWLRRKALLEEDPQYLGMHRITDAGRDALARLEESM